MYEGESRDEVALVDAAAQLGYVLTNRTNASRALCFTHTIAVSLLFIQRVSVTVVHDGRAVTYSVIHVNEFDADRRRMSVLITEAVSGAEGENAHAMLLCKGADTSMLTIASADDSTLRHSASRPVSSDFASSSTWPSTPRNEHSSDDSGAMELQVRREYHSAGPVNGPVETNSQGDMSMMSVTEVVGADVDAFAQEGLRTLCFGYRLVDKTELQVQTDGNS